MIGFNKLARKLPWPRRNWLSPHIYTGNPTYEPVHTERKCYSAVADPPNCDTYRSPQGNKQQHTSN